MGVRRSDLQEGPRVSRTWLLRDDEQVRPAAARGLQHRRCARGRAAAGLFRRGRAARRGRADLPADAGRAAAGSPGAFRVRCVRTGFVHETEMSHLRHHRRGGGAVVRREVGNAGGFSAAIFQQVDGRRNPQKFWLSGPERRRWPATARKMGWRPRWAAPRFSRA
jgi:hypothetical protein